MDSSFSLFRAYDLKLLKPIRKEDEGKRKGQVQHLFNLLYDKGALTDLLNKCVTQQFTKFDKACFVVGGIISKIMMRSANSKSLMENQTSRLAILFQLLYYEELSDCIDECKLIKKIYYDPNKETEYSVACNNIFKYVNNKNKAEHPNTSTLFYKFLAFLQEKEIETIREENKPPYNQYDNESSITTAHLKHSIDNLSHHTDLDIQINVGEKICFFIADNGDYFHVSGHNEYIPCNFKTFTEYILNVNIEQILNNLQPSHNPKAPTLLSPYKYKGFPLSWVFVNLFISIFVNLDGGKVSIDEDVRAFFASHANILLQFNNVCYFCLYPIDASHSITLGCKHKFHEKCIAYLRFFYICKRKRIYDTLYCPVCKQYIKDVHSFIPNCIKDSDTSFIEKKDSEMKFLHCSHLINEVQSYPTKDYISYIKGNKHYQVLNVGNAISYLMIETG